MSDRPVERSSSISDRRMVSSIPSARRSFKRRGGLFHEQSRDDLAARRRERERDEVRNDLAIRVQNIDQQGIGGPSGDARQIRAHAMALALALVTGLAIAGKDGRPALLVGNERESRLIARQRL